MHINNKHTLLQTHAWLQVFIQIVGTYIDKTIMIFIIITVKHLISFIGQYASQMSDLFALTRPNPSLKNCWYFLAVDH